MSLIIDGTFQSILSDSQLNEQYSSKHEYKSPLPYHIDERGPVQIMISDYTLNTMLNASLDLEWFTYIETMNGDAINNYIFGFDEAFGSFTDVQIKAEPVKESFKINVFQK